MSTAAQVLTDAGVRLGENQNIPPNIVIATTDRAISYVLEDWLDTKQLIIIDLATAASDEGGEG
jgi:hypothetical protein